MAGSAAVLEDSSLLSTLDKSLEKIEKITALMSGFAIFSLMFLAVYSVAGRQLDKTFLAPVLDKIGVLDGALLGYVDYIEAIMPIIAIMGISYVARSGTHIRMNGRVLWLFELISVLLMLVLMLALTWGAWEHFSRSFDCSVPMCSRDSSIDVALPTWPSKLVVPIAFGVLVLRLFLQAWGYARALVLGLENPVAVPLNLSIAEQARLEADSLEGGK